MVAALPAGFRDGDAAIVYPQHFADPAPALPRARRSALSAIAAELLLLAPLVAHAQDLASTPFHEQLPLPAAPMQLHPIATAQEPAGSFLTGRFLLGVNFTYSLTPDQYLGSHWSLSPVIRNTPR